MTAIQTAKRVKRYLHRRRPRGYFFRERHSDPLVRQPLSLLDFEPPPDAPRLVNVANFGGNAGDVLLPVVLRDLFTEQLGPYRWRARHVHTTFGRAQVAHANRSAGVVIGGGGLFFNGTNPNDLSGWQWSCSTDALAGIRVPIVVFAVGYNQFRGQDRPDELFERHVTQLVEQASFVGLRNLGSIEAVREILPHDLRERVTYQPCMTTVLRETYPHLTEPVDQRGDRPLIALNCAFDRAELRFGSRLDDVRAGIVEAMRTLARSARIAYFAHVPADEQAYRWLCEAGVPVELHRLYGLRPGGVVDAYRKPTVAIGMRGHAQMIPFGCGRPIVSLVSHDKLRYFLDDIGAPDWGVDVLDADLAERIPQVVGQILDDLPGAERRVEVARARLWQTTRQNLALIGSALDR